MTANPIWIAGYGPVAGAAPVWIAPGDGTVPSAVQSEIVSFFSPVAGATAVWIAGFFAPPPAAIDATPITISGWGGSGSGGGGGSTSVWSAADASANGMTLSNGGLTVTPSASGYQSIRGTISRTSGKYYAEFLVVAAPLASNGWALGLANAAFGPTSYLGASGSSAGIFGSGNQLTAGFVATAGGLGSIIPSVGDVWSIAVDLTSGNLWIGQNNTWLAGGVPGQINPTAGISPFLTISSPALGQAYFPGLTTNRPTDSWTLQSTAASQKYAPPSGFSAWDGGAAPPPTSVWSASDASANGMTLSNGGLTVTPSVASMSIRSVRSSISQTAGKFIWSF